MLALRVKVQADVALAGAAGAAPTDGRRTIQTRSVTIQTPGHRDATGKHIYATGARKCPICPEWSTGTCKTYRQKKMAHIKKWHPEVNNS